MKALSSILILLVLSSTPSPNSQSVIAPEGLLRPRRNCQRRTASCFCRRRYKALTTKVSEQTVEINKLKDAVQTNDFEKARLGQMEVDRDL
jgi:hypothetical protein